MKKSSIKPLSEMNTTGRIYEVYQNTVELPHKSRFFNLDFIKPLCTINSDVLGDIEDGTLIGRFETLEEAEACIESRKLMPWYRNDGHVREVGESYIRSFKLYPCDSEDDDLEEDYSTIEYDYLYDYSFDDEADDIVVK